MDIAWNTLESQSISSHQESLSNSDRSDYCHFGASNANSLPISNFIKYRIRPWILQNFNPPITNSVNNQYYLDGFAPE